MSASVRSYFGEPSHGTVTFHSTNNLCSYQDLHYGFCRHGTGRDITVLGDVNCTAAGIELQGGDHMVVDATVSGWSQVCLEIGTLWKFTNSDIKVRCGPQFGGSGRTLLSRALAAGDTTMYLADLPALSNQASTEQLVLHDRQRNRVDQHRADADRQRRLAVRDQPCAERHHRRGSCRRRRRHTPAIHGSARGQYRCPRGDLAAVRPLCRGLVPDRPLHRRGDHPLRQRHDAIPGPGRHAAPADADHGAREREHRAR